MEQPAPPTLYVCINHRSGAYSSCAARGSRNLLAAFRAEVAARGLAVKVEPIVCLGACEKGPNVRYAGHPILNGVGPDDVGTILGSAPVIPAGDT